MAKIKELSIRFKQSDSADVVKNRVRIQPPNSAGDYAAPYDDVAAPPVDADGYSRIQMANLPRANGLEGQYDIHVTALDAAGNESDFLEIDNQTFDLSPPNPPTDGSAE